MTTFAVYEHSVFGRKAVKNGFSAGGFFFPIIWGLMHKVWWIPAILLPWSVVAAAMDSVLSNQGGDPFGFFLAQLMFYHIPAGLIFGFGGNGILRSGLEKKGYKRFNEIEAQSPEDALAKIGSSVEKSTTAKLTEKPDLAAQISSLNAMRQQGALTDEEFNAAKAKLLR